MTYKPFTFTESVSYLFGKRVAALHPETCDASAIHPTNRPTDLDACIRDAVAASMALRAGRASDMTRAQWAAQRDANL